MLPIAILRVAPLVAAMNILTTVLPNGDVERSLFRETAKGVETTVEVQSASTGQRTLQRQLLLPERYGWRIEEERRTVIKAAPGHAAGTVRRAYVLSGWVDATPGPNAPPNPTEAFQFHAPTHEAAEALRDRLKKALSAKR